MDVKRALILFFGFAAYLAFIACHLSAKSLLLSPVWPVIFYSPAAPVMSVFSSLILGLPLAIAGFATKVFVILFGKIRLCLKCLVAVRTGYFYSPASFFAANRCGALATKATFPSISIFVPGSFSAFQAISDNFSFPWPYCLGSTRPAPFAVSVLKSYTAIYTCFYWVRSACISTLDRAISLMALVFYTKYLSARFAIPFYNYISLPCIRMIAITRAVIPILFGLDRAKLENLAAFLAIYLYPFPHFFAVNFMGTFLTQPKFSTKPAPIVSFPSASGAYLWTVSHDTLQIKTPLPVLARRYCLDNTGTGKGALSNNSSMRLKNKMTGSMPCYLGSYIVAQVG